ncbi:MAG TPA: cysteine protease StiP domain-containing protein [Streptosporangiaceae bacterium]|nr:cysteine protease StiP domain-containing protein [Streptosporangiaceae bacterium]
MLTGSYRPEEVSFLLTDLSGHALERGLREREQAIANGRNYAEMLPVEFAPSPAYLALFDALLDQSAAEVAEHVGVVTEMAFAARGGRPVLVSLARAGTPVGILMRRWAAFSGKGEVPHYSVSIVRGRGIDVAALDHIVGRHDPAELLFVDGWTGKGAIVTELAAALAGYAADGGPRLSADLAVIADPGFCASLFGTRQDVLVPSACLNSTVSGLVSRTVLNDELIGPGMFHGAKVYRELADQDRSARFLDVISGQFPAVAATVRERWPAAYAADRSATFVGARVVSRVQAEFGLPSQHLVKPGAGEATRVLLRRLPWRVLVRPDQWSRLRHLLLLAAERGVEVIDYPDMPYSCIGLISPRAGSEP